MVNAGVKGFKCFLVHSGVDEFPSVTESDVRLAMEQMQGTDAVFLVMFNIIMTFFCYHMLVGIIFFKVIFVIGLFSHLHPNFSKHVSLHNRKLQITCNVNY